MKLTTQIRYVSIILIILITGIGYVYYNIENKNLHELQVNENLNKIFQGIFELNIITNDYLQTNKPRAREQWQQRHASLTNLLLKADTQIKNEDNIKTISRIRKNQIISRQLFFKLITLTQSESIDRKKTFRPISEKNYQVIITKCRRCGIPHKERHR